MLKRQCDIVPLDHYAKREKHFYDTEKIRNANTAKQVREWIENYYISYGLCSLNVNQYPHNYADGYWCALASYQVTIPEARQHIINNFQLYILDHPNDPFRLLVTHLDWPKTWGGLWVHIPPPRATLPGESIIDKVLEASECI